MDRREKASRTLLVFFALFAIWSMLQFLPPLSLPSGSVEDLSGLTGISDNEASINKMSFPWNLVYSAGDRLCHQKAERSFFINDNQMPFCSRCTAIWLGMAIGLGSMIFYKILLNEKFLIAIGIGIVPIGIDGVGQLFKFWESTNAIRVITGLLIGIVCGIAIGLIIDEAREFRTKKSLLRGHGTVKK
ncbi:MAG: DUF2085 domain-containing protein [Candidatus Thermoplasmatota archaeon]|nr:DUF2085 domain-containing protein [Candidatus Thermoplasmatota archaeon]